MPAYALRNFLHKLIHMLDNSAFTDRQYPDIDKMRIAGRSMPEPNRAARGENGGDTRNSFTLP